MESHEENIVIPWSELLWDGISEDNGEFVRGQLLRRREPDGSTGYWICHNPTLVTFENGFYPAVYGWRKVMPSSLKRTEFKDELPDWCADE